MSDKHFLNVVSVVRPLEAKLLINPIDNVDFVDNVHDDDDLFYVPTAKVGNVCAFYSR